MSEDAAKGPISIDALPWEEWSEGTRFGSRSKHLTRAGGGSHVGVVLEELPPGKQSCPAHYHLLEEEHIYVIEGQATLRLGDARHILKVGDYVCFPAGEASAHALINETDKTFRFLVIGERNPNDVCIYPYSDKVYFRATQKVYQQNADVDYWLGESMD